MVAITMTPGRGSAEYFPAGDPRAGLYEPGKVYPVPEEVALALLEGGGYEEHTEEAAVEPAPDDEEASI